MQLEMQEERNKLERQLLTARRDEARRFAKKLEEKEQILEDVLTKLKSDPSRKLIAKSWEDIKFVKRDAINEAENIPSVLNAKKKAAQAAEEARRELVPLAEIRDRPTLNEGEMVTICKAGTMFGREATVVKDLGKQLQVQVSGLPMTFKHADLAILPAGPGIRIQAGPNTQNDGGGKSTRISKSVEKALMEESSRPSGSTSVENKPKSSVSIRMDSNTVDCRGCNLEDAKDKVKDKISKCLMNGQSTVYVLHGHGSGGVLKSKIRGWLKTEKQLIKNWAPADQADGGDAFTRLEL
jgi:dsDNA-specific endonuclease/ATPase MutS2